MTGPPDDLALDSTLSIPPPRVTVPYVAGYLRHETSIAIDACGYNAQPYPIDGGDPYSYARWFAAMWNNGGDLVVIEHDMVPEPIHVRRLIECEAEWCSHYYHVGQSVYTTGLGFCKFSHNLQCRLPLIGQYAMTSPRTRGGLVPWQGLNESIDRALVRRGVTQHVHDGNIPHLHYPEPADAR